MSGLNLLVHVILVATILSAILCAVTFLFALYRQFAMVEIAASAAMGVQLFSSTVGHAIQGKEGDNRKLIGSMALTAGCPSVF